MRSEESYRHTTWCILVVVFNIIFYMTFLGYNIQQHIESYCSSKGFWISLVNDVTFILYNIFMSVQIVNGEHSKIVMWIFLTVVEVFFRICSFLISDCLLKLGILYQVINLLFILLSYVSCFVLFNSFMYLRVVNDFKRNRPKKKIGEREDPVPRIYAGPPGSGPQGLQLGWRYNPPAEAKSLLASEVLTIGKDGKLPF